MDDEDFNELAGRVEAISRLLLNLIAELEDGGQLNGARLSRLTAQGAEHLRFPEPHLAVTKRVLLELTRSIDDARTYRQERNGQAGSHKVR